MAGYSDNREQNLEIKYLRKILTDVDERIAMPASLQGDVLRAKLDDIPVPAQPMRKALIFPRGWLSLRSGLTYAAAFVLIVGLFYGLGFDKRDDTVTGQIALQESAGASAEAVMLAPQASPDLPEQSVREDGGGPTTGGGAAAGDLIMRSTFPEGETDEAAALDSAAPFTVYGDIPADAPEAAAGGAMGVGGGGGNATKIGQLGDYVLSYRPNEGVSPEEQAASPNILQLLDIAGDAVVSQIDVPNMTEIRYSFISDNTVALVGTSQQEPIVITFDYSDSANPQSRLFAIRQGEVQAARVYKNVLHVVLTGSPEQAPQTDMIELPGNATEGFATFMAIDLAAPGGEDFNEVSFDGGVTEVKLYNINAYLYYTSTVEEADAESGTDELAIAQIKLEDLRIELGSIS